MLCCYCCYLLLVIHCARRHIHDDHDISVQNINNGNWLVARGTKIITELNSELNACSGGLFWEDSPAARRIYTDDEWLMVEHGHHVTKTRMLGRFVAAPSARLDRDPSKTYRNRRTN